ncbi:MFS transporter [Sphingobacterium thalpophilum]|uniref:MFS transporter n=1 Tax=Sphingobacterium thalpophilum TaxID=259 RepID=UPI0024A7447C|nr:MFS transporter [Sphingobacterium thalpophilum]
MISSLRHQSFYPWLVVALLWGVALLNYMDRQMLSTMRDAMQIDIPVLQSAEAFGALMAIFLYIYGIMSPIAGIVADRGNRKWLIVGSLFVWSAVTYGMGMANDYPTLLILRAIMGFSEALYIPTALSLIADYHIGKNRSLAIGLHMTGLYTGQALGGFGATLAASKGWHTAFHWFGIVGIGYAVILAVLLSEKRPEPAAEENSQEGQSSLLKSLMLIFSNVAFWILLFYFAAPSLPGWAIKNWLPTLFADNLHIPMSSAGPLSTITIAISSFVGVIVGGMVSDRWVRKQIRGRIYTSAIGLGLTIPALLFLGLGQTLTAVLGAAICFGIGFGMFDANNMPILCQIVPRNLRASAYGFMNMVGVFAGAAITQWLGRFKDEGHFGLGFAALGVAVLIALLLQLLFLKPKPTGETEGIS